MKKIRRKIKRKKTKKRFFELSIGDIFSVKSKELGGRRPGLFVKSGEFQAKHIINVQEDEKTVNFEPSEMVIVEKAFNMNFETRTLEVVTNEFRKVQQSKAELEAKLENISPQVSRIKLMADQISIEVRLSQIKAKINEQEEKGDEDKIRFDELTIGDRFSIESSDVEARPNIYVKSGDFEAMHIVNIENYKDVVVKFEPDHKVLLEKPCNMHLKSLAFDELVREYMRIEELKEDIKARLETKSPYLDPIDLMADHVSINIRERYLAKLFMDSREIGSNLDLENRSDVAKNLISDDFASILAPLQKEMRKNLWKLNR